MYDFLETLDDPDQYVFIEQTYLNFLYELPVADLLDRLERLQRAVPPPDSAPEVPAPLPDARESVATLLIMHEPF